MGGRLASERVHATGILGVVTVSGESIRCDVENCDNALTIVKPRIFANDYKTVMQDYAKGGGWTTDVLGHDLCRKCSVTRKKSTRKSSKMRLGNDTRVLPVI
jgi:hypothetical protein